MPEKGGLERPNNHVISRSFVCNPRVGWHRLVVSDRTTFSGMGGVVGYYGQGDNEDHCEL